MADPQHPAVPFEQAVDLLTGEPRQLKPQHPDIAALVERAKRTRMHDARFHPAEVIALIDDMAAALRTLTRPVEDEEVRATAAFLAESGNERVRESASLLARLAREKASAERERDEQTKRADHNRIAFAEERSKRRSAEQEVARIKEVEFPKRAEKIKDNFDLRIGVWKDRATRAEQEAARLREALQAVRNEEPWHLPITIRQMIDRALAAAGAEEPR